MINNYLLFTTPMCPNCPDLKEFMSTVDLEGENIDASTPEGLQEASKYDVVAVPTVVFLDEEGNVVNTAGNREEAKRLLENKTLEDV